MPINSTVNQRRNNNPRLTTDIGKFLDDISYVTIAAIITLFVLVCASYFYFCNACAYSNNLEHVSLGNAFYFSIITFSSLGYGDIVPIGSGKTVASVEVLFGLFSIAIIVGKLASERQSALLLLNYTSEQQRRLTKFIVGIKAYNKKLGRTFADYNHDELFRHAKDSFAFIGSITNHLKTHANEGRLTYSGNTPALRKLFKSIIKIQLLLYTMLQTAHVEQRTVNYIRKTLGRINVISLSMQKFYSNDAVTMGVLTQIQTVEGQIQKWHASQAAGKKPFRNRVEITEYLINKIKENLPLLPWEKDIDRTISHKLNIEHKMATRCIDALIDRGN